MLRQLLPGDLEAITEICQVGMPHDRFFAELVKEKTRSGDGIVAVPFIFKDDSHFYLYEKYEPPFSVAYCYTVPWI